MVEEEYTYREMIRKDFGALNKRMDTFETDSRNSLARLETNVETGFKGVHTRQDTANGKVNKIIIALIAVTFLAIGMGINNSSFIAGLIMAL